MRMLKSLFVVLVMSGVVFSQTANFLNNGWTYSKKITINNEKVAGDLVDFPVYVNLTDIADDDFWSNVKSDGGDIRVTNSNDIELPLEIVSIDVANKKGEIYFKADGLSGNVDTEFYLYYGNSSVSMYANTDVCGRNNVWSNGYDIVWHMNETSGYAENSVGVNNGTFSGNLANSETGKLGNCQNLNGNGDYVYTTSIPQKLVSEDFSLQIWVKKKTTVSILGCLFNNNTNAPNTYGIFLWYHSDGSIYFSTSTMQVPATKNIRLQDGQPNDTNWHYICATRKGNSGVADMHLYKDGDKMIPSSTLDQNLTSEFNSGGWTVGVADKYHPGYYFDGFLDEARLSNVQRSDEWISTEYNNQNNSLSFYSFEDQVASQINLIKHLDVKPYSSDVFVKLCKDVPVVLFFCRDGDTLISQVDYFGANPDWIPMNNISINDWNSDGIPEIAVTAQKGDSTVTEIRRSNGSLLRTIYPR